MQKYLYRHRSVFPLIFFIILVIVTGIVVVVSTNTKSTNIIKSHAAGVSSPCQFASAPGTVPAFCDSFDAPAGTGNRSGDLNGTIWGVSRISTGANFGQQQFDSWNPSTAAACNTQPLMSPHDVQVCNGQFVETVNDGGTVSPEGNGGQTVLAAYPKQPFDFAGRTGKVVFDVGDDTHGGHTAWPAFALTNLPVPAPYRDAPGLTPFAPNSFGFSLAQLCGSGSPCNNGTPGCPSPAPTGVAVDSAYITNNYALTQLSVQQEGCVKQPTQFGQLNHFEVNFTVNEVDIYATDAGADPSTQRLIAKITGFTMPLTRGFIWMEDVHYNACKYSETQCNHSFAWDNVGFDGPVLARDLSFDVLDNGSNGNLGWQVSGGNVTLNTVPTVTAANLAAAQGAVVTVNVEPDYNVIPTLHYSLNGGPTHTYTWPTNLSVGAQWPGLALPVPSLGEVKTGTNTITISTTGGNTMIANVDLKLLGAGGIVAPSEQPTVTPTPSASPCQFQKADPGYTVAFCDTFDQPMGTGNRSGDLNGLVWGVSRLSDGFNQGQGQSDLWHPNKLDRCGTLVTVNAASDIQICNGQMVETTGNDGGEGGEVELAMYPKQPFDIFNRTGTVTFDVTADSQGPHAAWPSFMYTDQPVPAPITSVEPPNISGSDPRNGFGVVFAAYGNTADNDFIDNCPNSNDSGVSEMYVVRNYVLTDINFTTLNCVKRPNIVGATADTSRVQGPLNHFEIRMSQNHVEVWGTDPGSTVLKELAVADNVNMPLTRGLIWIGDGRYNADKFNHQAIHTFAWDNVGFDGPILSRDLANDVNNATNGNNSNLGWNMSNTGSLQVPGVSNVSQASGALVTMNWFPNNNTAGSFNYRLNGNPWHTVAWPYGTNYPWSPHTFGFLVSTTEVINGTNTIDLDFNGVTGSIIANVNLIMIGAGGIPTCTNPSNCAGSQISSTPIPSITTTGVPTSTPTVPPIPTVTPTPTPTATLTPTLSPTAVPSPTPTIPASSTQLGVIIKLHGIGIGGDNANPNGGGNTNPLHPTRNLSLSLFTGSNQLVGTVSGSMVYQSSGAQNGEFTGTLPVPGSIPAGSYTAKASSPGYLTQVVPGIITVTTGQKTTLQTTSLTTGDINGDNKIDKADYDVLVKCFNDFSAPDPAVCSASQLSASNLDDNSVGGVPVVDASDLTLWLREVTTQNGG